MENFEHIGIELNGVVVERVDRARVVPRKPH
jgi:hypothetical protein